MSRNFFLRIFAVACSLGFVFLVVAEDDLKSSETIQELQSEKLSLLEQLVDRYQFGYSKGKPVLEELLAAKYDLLHAKLLIADSQANRVKLQEQIVENRRRLVEARVAGHKLGNNAEVDIIAARIAQIDAKIALRHLRSDGRQTR